LNRRRKIVVIFGIFLLLASVFSAVFIAFSGGLIASKTDASSPHYLVYHGSESRIFMISATSAFNLANQTYISADGQQVAEGSRLYTLTLTLRNDYTSDNPPPSTGTPTAPIDGTAYICLKATLLDNDVTVDAINLSPSDFFPSSADQTGLVLASGQTNIVQLVLATNHTRISDFAISLVTLNDSIPR
jgi:hypothetical protein